MKFPVMHESGTLIYKGRCVTEGKMFFWCIQPSHIAWWNTRQKESQVTLGLGVLSIKKGIVLSKERVRPQTCCHNSCWPHNPLENSNEKKGPRVFFLLLLLFCLLLKYMSLPPPHSSRAMVGRLASSLLSTQSPSWGCDVILSLTYHQSPPWPGPCPSCLISETP